jgi:hypothetical protein
VKLSKAQEIQKACDISGGAYAEKEAIHKFLAALEHPLQFLDFETFAPAIPLFDGTRPYQKIPFQYSLHVEEKLGELLHYSFLANGPGDPRLELLRQLKHDIRPRGSILTYNQSFEQGVLEDLARTFPEYADWIGEVVCRLSDLIIPFRNFHYYHPAQEGSASIKHVLPALVGQSYAGMNIADGEAASRAYLDMTYGNLAQAQKAQIRADLEKYCGLDTEAMVLIVKKLDQIGA